MFKFIHSANLRFGAGEIKNLGQQLLELGYSHPAIIVDQGVFSLGDLQQAISELRQLNITAEVHKNKAVEPTYDDLEAFKQALTVKDYDCLIGIGGGSTLDLTKGIAVLLTNPGPALAFRGFPELKQRPLPVIAIPTTAGSGSEATYNAVFTDAKEKKRLGINSLLNFPALAIVDPALTLTCPEKVTVSAGADALVHAIESFACKNRTPISAMYSKEAFRLLFNGLAQVLDHASNLEIRADLALGAHLAGVSLVNTGLTIAGAFSYPLGVNYQVPHGLGGAVFLAPAIKLNIEKGYLGYADLYDLIADGENGLCLKDKNAQFFKKMQALMHKLGIPVRLSSFGLGTEDINFMVNQYEPFRAAFERNPVEISKADFQEFIEGLV